MKRWISHAPASIMFAMLLVGPIDPQPLAGQIDPPSPEMHAMRQYIGLWRAEDRQDQNGRTFHFVYELTWFDQAESIVEMRITQRFANGDYQLLWKGFKGWRSGTRSVYYHGFSPTGRAAAGHVELEGDSLVTDYEGWSPAQSGTRIRDIFQPSKRRGVYGTDISPAWPRSRMARGEFGPMDAVRTEVVILGPTAMTNGLDLAGLELDLLSKDDAAAALELSVSQDWNQTAADWHRVINLAPRGCFAARAGDFFDRNGHNHDIRSVLGVDRYDDRSP